MELTARHFHCAYCQTPVLICRRCDHGNRYCGKPCAQAARRALQREAGCRYQRTYRGRLAHAARARRYRANQQIVTHQGSIPDSSGVLLACTDAASPAQPASPLPDDSSSQVASSHCHFCGVVCSPLRHLESVPFLPLLWQSITTTVGRLVHGNQTSDMPRAGP